MDNTKKAHEQLYDLWDVVKKEGDCTEYVNEMRKQLELLGTETNTLTKHMVYDNLVLALNKIKKSL